VWYFDLGIMKKAVRPQGPDPAIYNYIFNLTGEYFILKGM